MSMCALYISVHLRVILDYNYIYNVCYQMLCNGATWQISSVG